MPVLEDCAAGTTIRVAAIQMQADFAEVDSNLARAERLVREAFQQGAEWVILPEFFTTAIGVHSRMLGAARPLDGRPMQLLVSLAEAYEGVVGGSFKSLPSCFLFLLIAVLFLVFWLTTLRYYLRIWFAHLRTKPSVA